MPNSTLTKAAIAEKLYEETVLSHAEACRYVDSLIDLIKASLKTSPPLLISGFGKFDIHTKPRHLGRNPATRQKMTLDARNVVTYTYSKQFKQEINNRGK